MKQNTVLFFTVSFFALVVVFSCSSSGSTSTYGTTYNSTQPTRTTTNPVVTYWAGDGGRGIRLAVLEPTGKGLVQSELWLLSMIQSSITGDFQKFSAMTIVDRQNLENVLAEQDRSLSGNYSDADFIGIGHLTNAQYILAGSLTKTSASYFLELAVTDAESGERKASYPPLAVSTASLENLSAVKEATAELLRQLGVNLTELGRGELSRVAVARVQAETALARGIVAERQGTVVEALSYFIQADRRDSSLTEAASRTTILSANISSGNIGADTRNDIAWRRQWVTLLQETETFFENALRAPQPFYIVYGTDIEKGKVDYQRETVDLSIWMGFYPDFDWIIEPNSILAPVKEGLRNTKRAEVWGLDWPAKTISPASPFLDRVLNKTVTVVVEILDDTGKAIARQTVRSPYGYEVSDTIIMPIWRETEYKQRDGALGWKTYTIPSQWEGAVSFAAVNANAITDVLNIRIISIDGIAAETASGQKRISIMPKSEWDKLERHDDRYFSKIAHEYSMNKNNDSAVSYYTVAISLRPDYEHYYNMRSFSYASLNKYDRAIADLTEAIRLKPDYYGSSYSRRGDYYKAIYDYTHAIADYTEAIRLNRNGTYYVLHSYRGECYHKIGDYTRAIADYQEAIRRGANKSYYDGLIDLARQRKLR